MNIFILDLVSSPFAIVGSAMVFVIGILAIFFLILIGMKLINKASKKKQEKENEKVENEQEK